MFEVGRTIPAALKERYESEGWWTSEEQTEALELNPAAALQTPMDHIESVARRYVDASE